jgi:hypothetical protein
MGRYIPVEGHSGLVRDAESGAILNINKSEIEEARLRKENRKKQHQEIENLKKDVADIKSMLQQIVEKL